jgi:GNAT superfamily N-acetyltransferase
VGWAVAFENENEVYVVPEHRTYGYISELYVVEEARGQGIGRAMIAACETWARERGRAVIMIGTLSGNRSAFETYRRSSYAPYATFLKKLLK